MLSRALIAMFLLWASLVSPMQFGETADPLVQLKVAYIYNFTRFVDWPAISGTRPFVIGVIGDSAIDQGLRVLETENRQAQGRPIEIRSYASVDAIGDCDVLFVGLGAEDSLDAIVRRTAGAPTLLVGDTPGYAGRGVAMVMHQFQNHANAAQQSLFGNRLVQIALGRLDRTVVNGLSQFGSSGDHADLQVGQVGVLAN